MIRKICFNMRSVEKRLLLKTRPVLFHSLFTASSRGAGTQDLETCKLIVSLPLIFLSHRWKRPKHFVTKCWCKLPRLYAPHQPKRFTLSGAMVVNLRAFLDLIMLRQSAIPPEETFQIPEPSLKIQAWEISKAPGMGPLLSPPHILNKVTVLIVLHDKPGMAIRYLLFRKKPPKSRNGMITGGPIAIAMETLVLTQEMR